MCIYVYIQMQTAVIHLGVAQVYCYPCRQFPVQFVPVVCEWVCVLFEENEAIKLNTSPLR